MQCLNYTCQNRNALSGYCKLTACTERSYGKIDVGNNIELDAVIFPQTIGDITFYSGKQLVKWVEDQQKMNKNPEYGIGNWA